VNDFMHSYSWAVSSILVCGLVYGGLAYGSEVKTSTSVTSYVALLENPKDTGTLRINSDLFIKPRLSIGEAPVLIPDPNKSWQTMQARVWFDVPHTLYAKAFVQGGVGYLQGDPLLPSQNPWAPPPLVVPLGVGLDYPTDSRYSLTTLFSLNVTDLQVGAQNSHLTPGLSFGVRF
jgi:hypothetical protein